MSSTETSITFFLTGYLRDLFSLPPLVGRKVYALGAYEFAKMYDFPRAESGFSMQALPVTHLEKSGNFEPSA